MLHFGIALQVLVRITPLRDIRVDGDGAARGTDTIDRSRNMNGWGSVCNGEGLACVRFVVER